MSLALPLEHIILQSEGVIEPCCVGVCVCNNMNTSFCSLRGSLNRVVYTCVGVGVGVFVCVCMCLYVL